MSGRKPWSEITKTWSPEFKAEVDRGVEILLAEMPKHGMRNSRADAHRQIDAQRNGNPVDANPNGSISATVATATEAPPTAKQLEAAADEYIAAIRAAVEANGGKLTITAHFHDGDVEIARFSEIDEYQFAEF